MKAGGTVRVEVKQQALDGLGFAGSLALLGDLRAEGYRESRLDEYLDDLGGEVTPARVRDAVLAGQAVTHARPGRYTVNDEDGTTTYYLGAPASERRMRVYDKRGPTRVELQSRNDAAQANAAWLARSEDPARAVLDNIVSFADFRESKERDRIGRRRPRLPWWDASVGIASRAEGAPSRPRLSTEELALFVMQNWARSLALLEREYGREYIAQVLRAGRERLSAEDDEVIRESA